MRIRLIVALLGCLFGLCALGAEDRHGDTEPPRLGWWQEARFGMFIHIHLLDYPTGNLFVSFPDRIARASFLHDGSELKCRPFDYAGHANELGDAKENDTAEGVIGLPVLKPNVEIPVIEVVLKQGCRTNLRVFP